MSHSSVLTRGALGRAIAGVAGVGVVASAALVAAPATAATGNITMSCSSSFGPQSSTATFDTDAPASVYVGSGPITIGVTGTNRVAASTMGTAYDLLGARSAEGSSDLPVVVGSAASKIVKLIGPSQPIVKGQDLVTVGTGSYGTWTPPSTPGKVPITFTSPFNSTVVLKKADGSTAMNTTSACNTASPTDYVIDTVMVKAKSTLTMDSVAVEEGKAATAVASVAVTGGTAAGKVEFVVNGKTVVGTVTGGKATANLGVLPVGTHPVQATFVPTDATLYDGSQVSGSVTVSAAQVAEETSTSLSFSANPLVQGTGGKATATVAAATGTPGGTVRFDFGGQSVTGDLVDGKATVDVPDLAIGSYDVTAEYVPADPAAFHASASAPVKLAVEAPPSTGAKTTTELQLDRSTAAVGDKVTATATLSSAAGQPSGTVTFRVGAGQVQAPVTAGKATATLPQVAAGSYQVTASYTPTDPDAYAPSVSGAVALTVKPPASATSTSLSLSRAQTSPNEPATATAQVTSTNGSPQGSVEFTAGSATFTAPVSAGRASAVLTGLPLGEHQVTARFVPADPTVFAASTSAAQRLTVTDKAPAASTSTVLSLSRTETVPGVLVSAAANVSSAGGSPAGRVEFTVDGQTLRVPVTDGSATASLPALTPGSYPVRARFVPTDATAYEPSDATAATLTVKPVAGSVPTTTTLSVSNRRPEYLQPVAVSAKVAGGSDVQGTVSFNAGWTTLSVPVVDGVASATLPGRGLGTLTVKAQFTPSEGSSYRPSYDEAAISTVRATTRTSVTATRQLSKRTLKASARATSTYSRVWEGTMRYVLFRNGTQIAQRVVGLNGNGSSATTFAKVPKAGRYAVVARYSGGKTHLPSSAQWGRR